MPFLKPAVVESRRATLGLDRLPVESFVCGCEFISLGGSCTVAHSLEALNLRRFAYPFDWLRSPVRGIINCLETSFEDFLTFSAPRPSVPSVQSVASAVTVSSETVYAQARWGGSFWHHNPEVPETRQAFIRRIERLLGMRADEVPLEKTRVFVRAVNSTIELKETALLHDSLRRELPDALVLLLVLVDLQAEDEALRLVSAGNDLLIYRIRGEHFSESFTEGSMEMCCENYARAIAFAARFWAGAEPSVTAAVRVLPDIVALDAVCDQMDGGNAAHESFWPRPFLGQQIQLKQQPRQLPHLLPPHADVALPQGAKAGQVIATSAFGIDDLRVKVPADAIAGQLLRLRIIENSVRFFSVPSALGSDRAQPRILRAGANTADKPDVTAVLSENASGVASTRPREPLPQLPRLLGMPPDALEPRQAHKALSVLEAPTAQYEA